ncbi:MAG TPA: ABC transporter permease [bacterium]|nr:ABC transporter permease [bacterium]
MRAYLLTVTMLFRHYLRDRASLFWGLLFPLILMGLIGVAFGREEALLFRVSVVGGGPVAAQFRRDLARAPVLAVEGDRDESAALDDLRRGRRTLVVVLPPSGGTIRVYFDQARAQEARAALLILERFVAEANLRASGVPPALRVRPMPIAAGRRMRFFDFLLPGILAMTVMNSGLQGVSWVVTEYRQRLVLKRVLATPVHPGVFLGALVTRYALTNVVQLAVIMLIAVTAFGAVVAGSLAALAVLAVLGTLVFVGMGLAISSVSRTPESANLLGSLLNFPMLFLAGTLWPREFMPAALQPLISALPLTPLVETMRAVSARGESLFAHLPALAALGAWGLAAVAIAVWRFEWE